MSIINLSEDEIKQAIRNHFGLWIDLKLFTNPVGSGYVGIEFKRLGDKIILRNWRHQDFGLRVGSADLIGWFRGRFLAFEVKPTRGRMPTQAQLNFLTAVIAGGGIAAVVRSVADCERALFASKDELFDAILVETRKCKFKDEVAFIQELHDVMGLAA